MTRRTTRTVDADLTPRSAGPARPAVPPADADPGRLPAGVEDRDRTPRLRIGEAAAQAGVSARTLRYYQELGLLTPSATTVGGARRYSEADVARILRIRHLSDLVGLDLIEVARVLRAEDRLADIRREWWDGQSPQRRAVLLREAAMINDELLGIVQVKMAGLRQFEAGLEERAELLRSRQRELDRLSVTT